MCVDGGDDSCRILDGQDLHLVARIPLEPGPDAGIYDPETRIFYIGNGGRKGKQPYSYITLVSAAESKTVGRIRVESNNLEAMSIDHSKHLLYVNMRDKNQIGVVDLDKNEVRQVWSIPGLNLNTPMQLDTENHRLFVAGRKPGKLLVINTENGQLVTTMDCIETADDMIFDPANRRIYVSGSGGLTIVQQQGPDTYKAVEQFTTNAGKTSVLVPDLAQLYVIHTKTPEDNAALQVYKLNQ
ncbi:MAG: YncE family protein [Bryobacteraceae bacterium]